MRDTGTAGRRHSSSRPPAWTLPLLCCVLVIASTLVLGSELQSPSPACPGNDNDNGEDGGDLDSLIDFDQDCSIHPHSGMCERAKDVLSRALPPNIQLRWRPRSGNTNGNADGGGGSCSMYMVGGGHGNGAHRLWSFTLPLASRPQMQPPSALFVTGGYARHWLRANAWLSEEWLRAVRQIIDNLPADDAGDDEGDTDDTEDPHTGVRHVLTPWTRMSSALLWVTIYLHSLLARHRSQAAPCSPSTLEPALASAVNINADERLLLAAMQLWPAGCHAAVCFNGTERSAALHLPLPSSPPTSPSVKWIEPDVAQRTIRLSDAVFDRAATAVSRLYDRTVAIAALFLPPSEPASAWADTSRGSLLWIMANVLSLSAVLPPLGSATEGWTGFSPLHTCIRHISAVEDAAAAAVAVNSVHFIPVHGNERSIDVVVDVPPPAAAGAATTELFDGSFIGAHSMSATVRLFPLSTQWLWMWGKDQIRSHSLSDSVSLRFGFLPFVFPNDHPLYTAASATDTTAGGTGKHRLWVRVILQPTPATFKPSAQPPSGGVETNPNTLRLETPSPVVQRYGGQLCAVMRLQLNAYRRLLTRRIEFLTATDIGGASADANADACSRAPPFIPRSARGRAVASVLASTSLVIVREAARTFATTCPFTVLGGVDRDVFVSVDHQPDERCHTGTGTREPQSCTSLGNIVADAITGIRRCVVSADPPLTIVYDLLRDKDVQIILDYARTAATEWQESFVAAGERGPSSRVVPSARSASSTLLPLTSTFASAWNWVSAALQIPLDRMERWQIVRYRGTASYYDVHSDAFGVKHVAAMRGYQRMQTIFVYLNDIPANETQSYTSFPALGVRVRPKRGVGVWWNNTVWRDGAPSTDRDPRFDHAGEPPTLEQSIKYGLNIWIHNGLIPPPPAERRPPK